VSEQLVKRLGLIDQRRLGFGDQGKVRDGMSLAGVFGMGRGVAASAKVVTRVPPLALFLAGRGGVHRLGHVPHLYGKARCMHMADQLLWIAGRAGVGKLGRSGAEFRVQP
jgi:hypothetical protein